MRYESAHWRSDIPVHFGMAARQINFVCVAMATSLKGSPNEFRIYQAFTELYQT